MITSNFYFSNRRYEGVIPFAPQWNMTSEASRFKLLPEVGTNLEDRLVTGQLLSFAASSVNYKALDRQYVSPPLKGAQTISGRCTGFLQVLEVNANDNVDRIVTHMRLVSRDGLTDRGQTGYFVTGRVGTKEFNTVYQNRCIVSGTTNTTLTNMTGQDGDRIVLEIGYSTVAGGTSSQARAIWGVIEPAVTGNLTANEGQTSRVGWPWFRFVNSTLNFYTDETSVTCD